MFVRTENQWERAVSTSPYLGLSLLVTLQFAATAWHIIGHSWRRLSTCQRMLSYGAVNGVWNTAYFLSWAVETLSEAHLVFKMEKFAEFVSSIGQNGKAGQYSSTIPRTLPMSNHVESYSNGRLQNHEPIPVSRTPHLPTISQADTGNGAIFPFTSENIGFVTLTPGNGSNPAKHVLIKHKGSEARGLIEFHSLLLNSRIVLNFPQGSSTWASHRLHTVRSPVWKWKTKTPSPPRNAKSVATERRSRPISWKRWNGYFKRRITPMFTRENNWRCDVS